MYMCTWNTLIAFNGYEDKDEKCDRERERERALANICPFIHHWLNRASSNEQHILSIA